MTGLAARGAIARYQTATSRSIRALTGGSMSRSRISPTARLDAPEPHAFVPLAHHLSGSYGFSMRGAVEAAGDQLIGDVIEVIADDLRLGADSQNIVADPLDQCCFPAGRYGAKCVPCVARDKTELGRSNPKLLLDVGGSLAPAYSALRHPR